MITTQVVKIDPRQPDPAAIQAAAERLRAGEVVAFPTETVYGLGANALDPAAVAKIFLAKGRPAANPLIVHVEDVAGARRLTTHWPAAADQLAARFWPGPLALVLPKAACVPDTVTAGRPTVAARCPAHPVARALIAAAGVPIAAPSANLSNRVSATTAEHVSKQLNGRIACVLDGGPSWAGLESTVVDLTNGDVRILRPGPITGGELEECLGRTVLGPIPQNVTAGQGFPAPGMMTRHYAPRATLECVAADRVELRIAQCVAAGEHVGWLDCGASDFTTRHQLAEVARLTLPAEPAEYAAGFYAALHALDDLGVVRVVVTQPPQGARWEAIHDRLRRAAAEE